MQPGSHRSFFAVASLGRGRWYWVVWSTWAPTGAGASTHDADGIAAEKAEAIDQALERAGHDAEWLEARFAKEHYRQHYGRSAAKGAGPASAPLDKVEFLYRDHFDPQRGAWISRPHRVTRKSPRFVFVERRPYDPAVGDAWLDARARKTFRLDRAALEEEGYAFIPVTESGDPLFFTTPFEARSTRAPACFRRLGLGFPASADEVRAAYRRMAKSLHPDQGGSSEEFHALQRAYEEALRLCR